MTWPQDLVERFGRYDLITPEAWFDYDEAVAAAREHHRTYHLGGRDMQK